MFTTTNSKNESLKIELSQLSYFFLALVVTLIGALPFGLVNLTVLNVSFQGDKKRARNIALGASLIEILFGMLAVFAGSLLHTILNESLLIQGIIVGVLLIAGAYFIFTSPPKEPPQQKTDNNIFKGALLNLISLQVLLYWLLAMAYLYSNFNFTADFRSILFFCLGIFFTKLVVLWLYAAMSMVIISKSKLLSENINRIIGFLLVASAI